MTGLLAPALVAIGLFVAPASDLRTAAPARGYWIVLGSDRTHILNVSWNAYTE